MAENKSKKRDITTIAIPNEVFQKVESFCNLHDMTKRDFVESAINYFVHHNIDPRNIDDSPLQRTINELKQTMVTQAEQTTEVAKNSTAVTETLNTIFSTIKTNQEQQVKFIEAQTAASETIIEQTAKPKKRHWWNRNNDD